MTEIRSFSFGGGVQSTAALVLAAQGRIDFPLFLFANVGDDSENPATLRYVEEYAKPYAADHGIELVVLDRKKRDGSTETLMGRLVNPIRCGRCKGSGVTYYSNTDDQDANLPPDLDEPRPCPRCEGKREVPSRSLPIPVRMSNGAPGTRSCTADFKIKVIGKELKRRGATPENPATIGIGISVDEIHRANNRITEPHERITYPLLDLGLRRTDCMRVIRGGGSPGAAQEQLLLLPVPPAEDVARHAPGAARRVRKGVPARRTAQPAAGRARQGPRVPDAIRPAAAGGDPGRRGSPADVRRVRRAVRLRLVHDVTSRRTP
jgi:hypothetical protein